MANLLKRTFSISGKEKKVIFLHIPKTGGTTFRSVLEQVFPNSFHNCDNPGASQIKTMLKTFDCLELHIDRFEGELIYFNKHIMQEANWGFLKNVNMFIMFRNPVDRVLSDYSHFLRDCPKRVEIKNSLKKHGLCVPETLQDVIRLHENPFLYNKQLAFLLGKHQYSLRKVMVSSDLDYAKQLLRNLNIHIGVMERYEESLHIFETVTGKHIPNKTIMIKNQNPNLSASKSIDEETRNCIRLRNSLDQQLYEYAVELFEKQLAARSSGHFSKFAFKQG